MFNFPIERVMDADIDQLEKLVSNRDAQRKPYHMGSVGCKVLNEIFSRYYSKHTKQHALESTTGCIRDMVELTSRIQATGRWQRSSLDNLQDHCVTAGMSYQLGTAHFAMDKELAGKCRNHKPSSEVRMNQAFDSSRRWVPVDEGRELHGNPIQLVLLRYELPSGSKAQPIEIPLNRLIHSGSLKPTVLCSFDIKTTKISHKSFNV